MRSRLHLLLDRPLPLFNISRPLPLSILFSPSADFEPAGSVPTGPSADPSVRLSATESGILGVGSKLIASVVTYPSQARDLAKSLR